MNSLEDQSTLYNNLSFEYEHNKQNVDLELFNKCVDMACEKGKREIRFVLYKLKSIYNDDTDTGIDKANVIIKITKTLVGDSAKATFIIYVLEAALDELK